MKFIQIIYLLWIMEILFSGKGYFFFIYFKFYCDRNILAKNTFNVKNQRIEEINNLVNIVQCCFVVKIDCLNLQPITICCH